MLYIFGFVIQVQGTAPFIPRIQQNLLYLCPQLYIVRDLINLLTPGRDT